MEVGRTGFGGDADGGSGDGMYVGGGGDGRGRYGDVLSWWEDNIAHVTLWAETNDPPAYDTGL